MDEQRMTLKDALYWARTLSQPERAMELDGTDVDFLARATQRLLEEFDKVTNNAYPPTKDP